MILSLSFYTFHMTSILSYIALIMFIVAWAGAVGIIGFILSFMRHPMDVHGTGKKAIQWFFMLSMFGFMIVLIFGGLKLLPLLKDFLIQ